MTIPSLDRAPADRAPADRARNRSPLVIDATAYARRVILKGRDTPWEPAVHARHLGQVEALVRPDRRFVDLSAWLDAELEARPDLVESMGARSRTGYALRTLLADEAVAAGAAELLRIAAVTSGLPVVAQIPSPVAWLSVSHAMAGTPVDPDPDDSENASVYVVDWLRRFAEVPVETLLLDGRGVDVAYVESLDAYPPLRGAADHYRRGLALRTSTDLEVAGGTGAILDPAFWQGADVVIPAATLVLSAVPADADPETVLERRAALDV